MGKGLVAGGGKIVPPGKIIDFVGKAGGNLPGAVGGAGVHDDDFVHQIRRALQTARQYILFVFHDHTQADAYHYRTSFYLVRRLLPPAKAGGSNLSAALRLVVPYLDIAVVFSGIRRYFTRPDGFIQPDDGQGSPRAAACQNSGSGNLGEELK